METKKKENIDLLSKKGTCIEFFSAYQEMDLERMVGLCNVEGSVQFKPLGEAGKGSIGSFGRNLWSALMDSFPDLDNTVITMDGDDKAQKVTCKVNIFGKQEKEFANIIAKGNRFESEHIFIFHFDEKSKIDCISIDWDHVKFVEQLTN